MFNTKRAALFYKKIFNNYIGVELWQKFQEKT